MTRVVDTVGHEEATHEHVPQRVTVTTIEAQAPWPPATNYSLHANYFLLPASCVVLLASCWQRFVCC